MKEKNSTQPDFVNHLINEKSPYLRQHAHNPVNWYPWGKEAFEKAKREDKPILLSIGYSACHWCHVMAHESFENESVASLMNDYFINIKVDREEYPDVDHLYQTFVQMATYRIPDSGLCAFLWWHLFPGRGPAGTGQFSGVASSDSRNL